MGEAGEQGKPLANLSISQIDSVSKTDKGKEGWTNYLETEKSQSSNGIG